MTILKKPIGLAPVSQGRITTADNFGLWPQRVKTRDAFILRADGVLITGSNDFDSLLGSDIRINFLGDLFLKNQGPSPIGSRAARNYSLRQTVNLRIAIFRPHAARPAARIKSKRTPLKKSTRQLLRTRDEVRLVTILLTAVMRDAQLAKLRGVDWATRVHANKPVPEPKNRADRRRCSPRCPICLEAG